MIFESFKTGDAVHDCVVEAYISGEMTILNEKAIFKFLKEKMPSKANKNTAVKIYKKIERQIINRKLTYNKLSHIVSEKVSKDHPKVSKDEVRKIVGFRRQELSPEEFEELLYEMSVMNKLAYETIVEHLE